MTDMADSIRADREALVKMLVESVRLADWAAGEGILGPDGFYGPEEFLCDYVDEVGVCPDDGAYADHAERKLRALLSENARLREQVAKADELADACNPHCQGDIQEYFDAVRSAHDAYRATQKDESNG